MDAPLLTNYGIQTEQSDLRAHVCVQARRVYVYRTRHGLSAVQSGAHRCVEARTTMPDGRQVVTARGYLVPPDQIAGCTSTPIPTDLLSQYAIDGKASAAAKGQRARLIVQAMLLRGLIPLPAASFVATDLQEQINGIDLHITASLQMQVKCDFSGGTRAAGGSGSLFLQVAEANPNKTTEDE